MVKPDKPEVLGQVGGSGFLGMLINDLAASCLPASIVSRKRHQRSCLGTLSVCCVPELPGNSRCMSYRCCC